MSDGGAWAAPRPAVDGAGPEVRAEGFGPRGRLPRALRPCRRRESGRDATVAVGPFTTATGRSRPLSRQQQPPNLATRRERRLAERAERAARPRQQPGSTRRPIWQSPIVLITGLAVIVGVAIIGAAVLSAPKEIDPDATGLVAPPVALPAELADGEAIGQAGAPVLMEVWSDFQCPVCGSFAKNYLPRLVTDFVAAGQLRIVDKSIDILGTGSQSESLDAAVGAVCAGRQDRYWAYHDYLFWNQAGENRGAFSRERLTAIAVAVELDRSAWEACFSDGTAAEEVTARRAQAPAKEGVIQTPTFVINGQATVGLPRTYDDLAALVRAALPDASASGSG
jgi:protein-disulfide isomerase